MKFSIAFLFFFISLQALSQISYHQYVDPLIGSEGDGHIFIGPSCPYGMVKPGPDNLKTSNSGYSPDADKAIYGFSQVHVSGTGGGPKYGNISVMPFSGNTDPVQQESLRSNEVVKAGYYSVLLDKWKIKTEITTSPKVSYYRFSFAEKNNAAIKIDCGEFLGEKPVPDAREAQQFVGSEIEIVSDTEVRGYSKIRGGWNNGAAYTVYFHAVFSQPFSSFKTWKGTALKANEKVQTDEGKKTGAMLLFDAVQSGKLEIKIGISYISVLKAKQNLTSEIPHWNFEKVRGEAEAAWDKLLSKIEIDTDARPEQKIMFYTALYHTMLMPVDRTGENPKWESGTPYYDDFYAIWDTFRSSHPLITLIDPGRQVNIVNALLQIYLRDGYLPDARSGNANGRTQGGSNAEVLIADAYAKGLKGINYSLALEAMLKDATVPPGGNEEQEGRGGLTDYNSLGYVSNNFVRAGNRTVEYAYDDYCLGTVAMGLNRKGEGFRFLKQANNWQNLWRPVEDNGSTGFIMPRDALGNWIDSIQCDVSNGRATYIHYTPLAQDWPVCLCWWCGFFYEASSWEYSLSVPHDVAALIQKSGGPAAFEKRLNTLFDKELYNVGNEPSFLTPNLYHWIGKPNLSSERIQQIISKNYNASHSGIPGNDDSGAMSSWLAFHLMGLYPNAGQSYYLLNTPFFKQTIIHQEGGKDIVIKASNLSTKNKYIQSATLNGKAFQQSWIEHAELTKGGELIFEMTDKPSDWGTQTVPPSMSTSSKG